MKLELTAVFKKIREGYVAFVEELPGAIRNAILWRKPVPTLMKRLCSFWRQIVR
ncbi:MAG: hypothetical protein ACREVK_04595 [Gammaproteobacteria bacterium]